MTDASAASIVLSKMFTGELERAILQTLAYSDVFDFPLRLEEIHRYLPMRAGREEICTALISSPGVISTNGDYYFLAGREQIVNTRKKREAYSRQLLPIAIKYGRILGSLPFVRMVGLTGSLAVLNVSGKVDFDFMLVTVPGSLWTARAFALLFNRVTKRFGHTICPNLIVTETSLEWRHHDLYSARELCQMIPITGVDVYQCLLAANTWVKNLLPNAFMQSNGLLPKLKTGSFSKAFQNLIESPLRGKTGDRFEQWEMDRKISRFSKQAGFGEETVFTANICQGNFDHHRKWTEQALRERISLIDTLDTPEKEIGELS